MHTEVTMLLIDKCGICGLCRSPRALAQEGKGEGVAQCSNHTPWRHPWLSGPGNWAAEASGELENMWQTDLFTGLFLAPLGKNPQPVSSPKAGEIKANCTVSVLFLIYSVNIRIKERKVGGKRERDNKMRRGQRKWKAWDIWTAVREATGKTLDSWRHLKEFYL